MATEKHKLSVSCFQLSLKENEVEKIFYVRSNWKVNPFKDLSGRDDKVICDLSITDCKAFWSRNVKLIDLKDIKPDNIRNPKDYCEATQAALSGLDTYGNQKLSCLITVNDHHARLTWNWSMQQAGKSAMAIQFTLGSISLYPVSQFETVKMWEEWVDFFIDERNQLIKSKSTYEIRVNDLEETKNQMQEKIESIISDKINNQTLLVEKFKKVLNTKKKKVKKLMKVLNANGAIMSSELQVSHELSDKNSNLNEHDESSDESESSGGHYSKSSRSKSTRPSKKTKLDEIESKSTVSISTIASESPNEDQKEKSPQKRPESVLTKTFRGQVIKSRRMGRKPVTRSTSRSNDSLDNLLNSVEEPEPIAEVHESNESEEAADDLLAQL